MPSSFVSSDYLMTHLDHPCRVFCENSKATQSSSPSPLHTQTHTHTYQHITGSNIDASSTQDAHIASDIPETTDYEGLAVSATTKSHRESESTDLNIRDKERDTKIEKETYISISFVTGSGTSSGRVKRPAVSLSRFLRETEKRRRIVLDEIIGIN